MAQKGNYSNQKTNYLSINANGILYSKTTEDNPEAVKVTNKEGDVYYHELFEGGTEIGTMRLNIGNTDFGKRLRIFIQGETETDCVDLPLFTQNGSLTSYVSNLIMYLPNLDPETKISLRPSTETYVNKKGETKLERRFFIKNHDTDKYYSQALKVKTENNPNGEVPPIIFKKRADGIDVANAEEQTDFLYKVLEEQIGRFQSKKQNIVEEKPAETKKEVVKETKPSVENDEVDDLPF